MEKVIKRLACRVQSHAKKELLTPLSVEGSYVFRIKRTHAPVPTLYKPMMCLIAQGSKNCHIGEEVFSYSAGDLFINFLPMPVETEVINASDEEPLLSVALDIDLVKLADMILRIERAQSEQHGQETIMSSSIVTGEAPETVVELFGKLLDIAHQPLDAIILGEAVIDEIYYRLLTSHYGNQLRTLLSQYGQIQPISRAVNYIHDNLHRTFQVSELAEMTHMSKTAFFNTFKKIMHVSPNQYIKSTKLRRAQVLLSQGIQATEASFRVGYNSFSQFSREYKRLFGYSPSETVDNLGDSHPVPLQQILSQPVSELGWGAF